MKIKLFTIAMMVAFIMTAMTKVQAQNFEGPCLPSMHGLDDHQSAFCGSTVTQTIALSAGVNWFSTYVEIALDDLKAALVDALPNASATNAIIIKSQRNGQATYNGTRWRGALDTFDVAYMYQVTVPESCEIMLEGMLVDPADHPISIKNGPNWIGFPLSASMTPTDAFAGLPPVSGDVLKSKTQQTNYSNRWRGALNNLVPGQGYIYNSAATGERTLVFPTSAK